jgi:hypothetical protein
MHFRTLALAATVLLAVGAVAVPPLPYQRVLIPISVFDVPGANGALWTTELWGFNGNAADIVYVEPLPCLVISMSRCATSFALPPGRSTRVLPYGTAQAPGVLMLVPSHLAEKTYFTLHVRDLNRQSESWGAQIPVVRERDLLISPTHMTNIPFGSDYRQTLRIYALLSGPMSARFRVKLFQITGSTEDRLLTEQVITFDPPPVPPPNQISSPLVQLTLTDMFLIEIGGVNRVRVTIEPMTEPTALLPPIPYWAFVSITNNRTNEVTTVVPR